MQTSTNDNQDKYISLSRASGKLSVSFERISWFIATGKLSSKADPQDRSKKLVSLRDVYRLRDTSPQLLASWLIYALVDPRDNSVRYVGRTNEPQKRFRQHLNSFHIDNPAKYSWIQDLKEHGLLPRMEILEGINGTLKDADVRENAWIEYFKSIDVELLNLPNITQKNRNIYNSEENELELPYDYIQELIDKGLVSLDTPKIDIDNKLLERDDLDFSR